MRKAGDYRDIPERYQRWRLSDFSAAVQEAVKPFLACLADTVYLHGAVGTKKTSLAAAVLREWRGAGNPSNCGMGYGEFVDAERFAGACRDMDNGSQKMSTWRYAGILVLDDIGAARSTPAVVEQLGFLVSDRYNRCLPTIATGNLSLPELATALDARIASRFQEGIVLDLGSADARAK